MVGSYIPDHSRYGKSLGGMDVEIAIISPLVKAGKRKEGYAGEFVPLTMIITLEDTEPIPSDGPKGVKGRSRLNFVHSCE